MKDTGEDLGVEQLIFLYVLLLKSIRIYSNQKKKRKKKKPCYQPQF